MRALGDRAIRVPRPPGPSARAIVDEVRCWPGVVDVVVAREDLAIYFDNDFAMDFAKLDAIAATDDDTGRVVELPAIYDGADLEVVAAATGLARADVIARHAGGTYRVDLMGFAPGFAYLGGLDERLALPRRATPRTRVPAGSIAIAGRETAVYPFASPGGWHLLGRVTGVEMFGLLQLGDRVRFVPSAERPLPARAVEPPAGEPALEVVQVTGLVTVQDLGRRGRMHEGVPPGGALVPELLVDANARAGNPGGAAALEVMGRVRVRDVVTGEERTVDSHPRRVAYLAVPGGIAWPRPALLCAGVGAPLRAGDVVHRGTARGAAEPRSPSATIRALRGPDIDAFPGDALARFAATPWRISPRSDRVGTRLDGGAVERLAGYREVTRPMTRGAIEVPPDGRPIVLGPEHPTTGGYPVLAVVAHDDLGALFALPAGAPVRLQYV